MKSSTCWRPIRAAYDGLDRLTSASGIWGAGVYGYDGLDNLRSTTVGGRMLTHSYDASNRLVSLSGSQSLSYGFDVRGNWSRPGFVDTSPLDVEEFTMADKTTRYTAEFKRQMVGLTRIGRTPASVAKKFGPSAMTIGTWIKQSARDAGGGDGGARATIFSSTSRSVKTLTKKK